MAEEFFQRGTSRAIWLASAPANLTTPTTVEIAAGLDLSEQLNGIDGFSFKTTFVDVENLASRTTTSISGPSKADGGSLTFNEKKNPGGATPAAHDDIMVALAKDEAGYLLLARYGTSAGNDCEIWRATVGSFSRSWDMGNNVAKFMVEMAATDVPEQHATISSVSASSLSISPATLTIDVSDGDIRHAVATVTFSDSSTLVVTNTTSWVSSDPAKATVDSHGYITAVAAGSTTVTGTYAGLTDTVVVTVTA